MKKGKWSLKGELSDAPSVGFDYAGTRRRITSLIQSFKRIRDDGKEGAVSAFSDVKSFEVKPEGAFELILWGSRQFDKLGSKDGERRETAIVELLAELQTHCGIGNESEPEMGVLTIAYFTDFKDMTEE